MLTNLIITWVSFGYWSLLLGAFLTTVLPLKVDEETGEAPVADRVLAFSLWLALTTYMGYLFGL